MNAKITDIQIDGGDTDDIDENTTSETSVGTLTTTGGSSPYTYELTSGTGDEDNSLFIIDSDELKLNFTLDHENPTDLGDTVWNNIYATRVKVINEGETVIVTDGDDYSSARNNYGGFYNSDNYPNVQAFATLRLGGSITAWGNSTLGGSGAPVGIGYLISYGGGTEVILPNEEYEKQLIISVNDAAIIIPNPHSSQIDGAVNNGYITIDNGVVDNTTQTTT